jgi:hypothetical protein
VLSLLTGKHTPLLGAVLTLMDVEDKLVLADPAEYRA